LEFLINVFLSVLLGHSKNGSPISFEHTGRANPSGMLKTVSEKNMNDYALHQLLFMVNYSYNLFLNFSELRSEQAFKGTK
jgi:hypothetical protein